MLNDLNTNKNKEEIEHIVIYIDNNSNIKKVENHNLNNNVISDMCKESCTNNFIYIGEWKSDMREGKGTYYNHITKEKYEGEFKYGKADGKGIFYYNNGDIYIGEFKNWIKEGYGVYYFQNGDRYEGYFKNGVPNKEGKYFYMNSNQINKKYSK